MKIKFKAKRGQVDYTNVRWAPVINCLVQCGNKILLIKRSGAMRLYPNYWSGVFGFLDDSKSLNEKVREELKEEAGISKKDIVSVKFGRIFDQDDPRYKKTWIVHPILVRIRGRKIGTDWETERFLWTAARQAKKFRLLPGFGNVLKNFFPKSYKK